MKKFSQFLGIHRGKDRFKQAPNAVLVQQQAINNQSTEHITFYFYGYGPEFTFTCPKGTTWKEFYDNYPEQYTSGMQWLRMGSDGYPYWVTFYIINSEDKNTHVFSSDVIIAEANYTVDTSATHPDA